MTPADQMSTAGPYPLPRSTSWKGFEEKVREASIQQVGLKKLLHALDSPVTHIEAIRRRSSTDLLQG